MNNLPRLNFTYFKIDQLPLLEEILSSDIESLKEMNSRYSLISHTTYPMFHDCNIYNFIYDDLMEYKDSGYLRMFYNEFIEKFGQEKVDLFVVKDKKEIENKIYDAIVFAFDKVYKTDKIEVSFINDPDLFHYSYSILNIIYSVLTDHFTIIKSNIDHITKIQRIIISSIPDEDEFSGDILFKQILDSSETNDVK